jgi:hypothetical protein
MFVFTSSGEGWVKTQIAGDFSAVEPGQRAEMVIHVVNQGPAVDHFSLRVRGVPKGWVIIHSQRVRMDPGGHEVITLAIHPPRDPQSRAGCYPLILEVASENDPQQQAVIKTVLKLETYTQIQARLHPLRIYHRQFARVTVENQGNAEAALVLKWKDPAAALQFSPTQAGIRVFGGQISSVEFSANPVQRPISRGMCKYPFEVIVGDGDRPLRTLAGEYITRGLFPWWFLVIVMILILALAAGAYSIGGTVPAQKDHQSQTATPGAPPMFLADHPFKPTDPGKRFPPEQQGFGPPLSRDNTYNLSKGVRHDLAPSYPEVRTLAVKGD